MPDDNVAKPRIVDDDELVQFLIESGLVVIRDKTRVKICTHPVLSDNGPLPDLPPKLAAKYPDGIRLGTCKECGTTLSYCPFNEACEWPQLK